MTIEVAVASIFKIFSRVLCGEGELIRGFVLVCMAVMMALLANGCWSWEVMLRELKTAGVKAIMNVVASIGVLERREGGVDCNVIDVGTNGRMF